MNAYKYGQRWKNDSFKCAGLKSTNEKEKKKINKQDVHTENHSHDLKITLTLLFYT